MKKLYSFIVSVFAGAILSAQAFTATYDFTESPTNTDAGTLTGTNFTVSTFSASGLSYSSTTGNRYSISGAPLTGLDTTKYIEVTLTPDSGYKMSISSLTFKVQRSGTGPRDISVRSSVDGYANNLGTASINPANAELSVVAPETIHYVNDISTAQVGATYTISSITDVTAPVVLRFYPFTAEATGGTFSVDDVVIGGTVVSTTLGTVDNVNNKTIAFKNTLIDNTLSLQTKGNAIVKVYNMNGQLVKTAQVSTNAANVDVSALAKGNYVVTAELNGEKISQKIIKK